MFTGIVQAKGRVAALEPHGDDVRLHIDTADLVMSETQLGDSISVSGVCLTVIEKSDIGFWADVSIESLNRSTLGRLRTGSAVNVEQAVTPSTALGGHLVNGHVDATGDDHRACARCTLSAISISTSLSPIAVCRRKRLHLRRRHQSDGKFLRCRHF